MGLLDAVKKGSVLHMEIYPDFSEAPHLKEIHTSREN